MITCPDCGTRYTESQCGFTPQAGLSVTLRCDECGRVLELVYRRRWWWWGPARPKMVIRYGG